MSITPIILTLGIIIFISSFIIPLILKLMNKKVTQKALRDGLEAYLYGICNNFGLQNVEIIIQ